MIITRNFGQVGVSARKSLSARFFAQSNSKLSRTSLFPPSPVGNRVKGRRDNQELLVNSDVLELTPGKLFAADSDSSKLHEQQVMALTCT